MNKDKVAIISDLHLGVHTNSPTWHEISLTWAKWLCAELQEKDIEEIFFCGDFFHSRSEITVNTLHVAASILEIFKSFKITLLAGNHDSFYKTDSRVNSISIFNGRPNINVIDKPTLVHKNNRDLFFAPWGTDLNDMKECDMMFGHFEIESFKMNSFKVCDHGFKSTDLFKYTNKIVSGHFHLRDEREYEKGTILYVGSPFELDFGDAGSSKGYYILDLKNLKYDFYENNISPKHQKIALSELIKLKDFKGDGSKIFKNNIVKLSIDKNIETSDLDKLSAKISSFIPISITYDHVTVFDLSKDPEIDLSGVDIPHAIEEFVGMLDIANKKEVVDYTVSLYNTCK